MGFFSSKKENDKKDEALKQVISKLYKNCPKCGTANFQIMDSFVGNGNTIYDMNSFTGGTTGVCSKCGFIAHGQVFYKGTNLEASLLAGYTSLNLLNMWTEKMLNALKKSTLTGQALADMANSEFDKFFKEIKSAFPDYCAKVDFVNFVKLCQQYKYKKQ